MLCGLVEVSMNDVLVWCVESGVHECNELCTDFLASVCFFVVKVYGREVDRGLCICCWL